MKEDRRSGQHYFRPMRKIPPLVETFHLLPVRQHQRQHQNEEAKNIIETMPPPQHRRTQNILLFQKLLNLRDGASPFTLLLDSLESRAAKAVTAEFMSRAKVSYISIFDFAIP